MQQKRALLPRGWHLRKRLKRDIARNSGDVLNAAEPDIPSLKKRFGIGFDLLRPNQ